MTNPAVPLSAARIGIGAVALVAPDLAFRGFLLDPRANRQSAFVTRLFGSREVAIGVAALAAARSGRRGWVAAGAAVDAADAVAGYLAGASGLVSKRTSAVLTAAATAAAVTGLVSLRRPR